MIPWEIKARSFTNCNCAYGCPCQFNALPTKGHCEAIAAMAIDTGHFDDTRLDGLHSVLVVRWPGAIHEGHGKAFIIIDEKADDAQRKALLTILSGEETNPGATIWNVFASTFDEVLEPVFKPIDMTINVDECQARVNVPGLIEMNGEVIHNPVTGEPHRAQIRLDKGFEYKVAEMGSGTSTASGPISLTLNNSYGQFNVIHLNNHGIVR